MKRVIFVKIITLVFIGFLLTPKIFAMESTNYKVEPDVLDQTGGYSTSDSYRIWHNLGETITGQQNSSSYRIHAGYFRPDVTGLEFTISKTNINLGTLTMNNVATDSIVITVTCNTNLGYSIKAYDDTPTGIAYGLISGSNYIVDATTPNNYINLPLAGVEHYGIKVTGTHAASGYAGGTKINSLNNSSQTEIGSYGNKVKNDTYTIEYRASISEDTPTDNNFSARTTFVFTANY